MTHLPIATFVLVLAALRVVGCDALWPDAHVTGERACDRSVPRQGAACALTVGAGCAAEQWNASYEGWRLAQPLPPLAKYHYDRCKATHRCNMAETGARRLQAAPAPLRGAELQRQTTIP